MFDFIYPFSSYLQDPDDGDGNQSGGGGNAPDGPPADPPAQSAGLTQTQVDAIVKDRLARQQAQFDSSLAAIGIDGGLNGLQEQYRKQQEEAHEAAKARGQYKSLYEAEQKRGAELQARLDGIETERRQAVIRESLTGLAADAVSPAQVAQLVQADLGSRGLGISVVEGAAMVVDSNGNPVTDGQGSFMTANSVVSGFLERNPHFRKPTAPGTGAGAGSRPGQQTPPQAVRKQGDDLFGDLSNTENVAKHKDAIKQAIREGRLV